MAQPAGADLPEPSPAPVPVGSETVLLVEDATGVRQLTRTVLEAMGYRVIVCNTVMTDDGQSLAKSILEAD